MYQSVQKPQHTLSHTSTLKLSPVSHIGYSISFFSIPLHLEVGPYLDLGRFHLSVKESAGTRQNPCVQPFATTLYNPFSS